MGRRPFIVAILTALLVAALTGAVVLDTPLRSLLNERDGVTPVADAGDADTAGEAETAGDAESAGAGDPAAVDLPSASTSPSAPRPSSGTPSTESAGPAVELAHRDAGPAACPDADSRGEHTPAVDGEVPAGYRRHDDETGFSVVVPADWAVERESTYVDFEDPDSGRFLRIDQTDDPKGDPVADWVAQEQVVRQRLAGYELLGIEGVDYRGWEAADWEFTFGVTTPTHVLNRNVVTGPMAYALYWSVPAPEWESSAEVFDIAAASFEPFAG